MHGPHKGLLQMVHKLQKFSWSCDKSHWFIHIYMTKLVFRSWKPTIALESQNSFNIRLCNLRRQRPLLWTLQVTFLMACWDQGSQPWPYHLASNSASPWVRNNPNCWWLGTSSRQTVPTSTLPLQAFAHKSCVQSSYWVCNPPVLSMIHQRYYLLFQYPHFTMNLNYI